MLEKFTVDTFGPLVGGVFLMHVDATNVLELQLIEALPTDMRDPPGGNRPFSLVFRGPRASLVVQRIYQLDHVALGSFELFLVPIGPDERGMLYEAVFT